MPNAIEPTAAQTNIAKFNKSAIAPPSPRSVPIPGISILSALPARQFKPPAAPRRVDLCDCRRDPPALTLASVNQVNTPRYSSAMKVCPAVLDPPAAPSQLTGSDRFRSEEHT